ncbi:MAG: helix-turn-helix transcriptional regulator [Erysipelotrichaceae bacterium]|nr:helix-turn-helix transcriptional regulator [Erysipelotrichaceae bacterium]
MDNRSTGDLIKKLRTDKGLTQQQLADRLSVTTAAVSKWERGKGFPDVSLLEELANELGISISELVKGKMMQEEESSNNDELIIKVVKESGRQYGSKLKF